MTAPDDPFEGFAVCVTFDGTRAVLGVRGEIDLVTARELGALLDTVIDQGHRSVALDLADVAFMDASGLRVIARGVQRLGLVGGTLTLRAPPAKVQRILAITHMTDLVDIDPDEPAPARLGPEQSVALPTESLLSGPIGLTQPLRAVAAIPADDDLIDAALRLVVALARATVGGADGASVSLLRHGRLATVAATDQTISDMDAHQYATGEGPCVDASVEGRWFHIESLDTETRWPDFTPKAQALGINAILSSPLLAHDQPVGALNIYSRTATAFAPEDQDLASLLAAEASVILSDAGVHLTDDEQATRLQDALWVRQVIAQAQGVIMERDGGSADDAFTTLRLSSVANGNPLREQAREVLESAHRPRPTLLPGPEQATCG
jgi:anti-anti-sigma factor